MAGISEWPYEFNEISWWSNWAATSWLDENSYVMLSEEFDEYFFNRGGLVRLDAARFADEIRRMEEKFTDASRRPYLFVQNHSLPPTVPETLAKEHYRVVDQMSVMEAAKSLPFRVNPDVRVEVDLDRRQAEEWTTTYLDAFYGERGPLAVVTRIVEKVSSVKEASLVLATLRGQPAGVLALFRTGEICGVYCVGTSPGSRGAHVASTMLKVAMDVAAGERRKLVLQTILSDSVEALYTKLGFERLYLKDLFAKGTGGLEEG